MSKKEFANKRICLACGKVHAKNELCPIIKEKQNRYFSSHQKNFLMGNILLECIKQNVDFCQILLEIVEKLEESEIIFQNNSRETRIIPLETVIEYFAISLNCNSHKFFRQSGKTVEEYYYLLQDGWFENGALVFSKEGVIDEVSITLTTDTYKECNTIAKTFGYWNRHYEFNISRISINNNEFYYQLSLSPPIIAKIANSNVNKLYYWEGMDLSSASEIVLAKSKTGKLKDWFEEQLDSSWTEDDLTIKCSYKDPRFNIWMEKLEIATKNSFLKWEKINNNHYYTCYGKIDIEILTEISERPEFDTYFLYVRCLNGIGLRFGHSSSFIEIGDDDNENNDIEYLKDANHLYYQQIRALIILIEKDFNDKKYGLKLKEITSKTITYTDVLVIAKSMICHNSQHHRIPYRGIVKLLRKDGAEIDYEVYVAYCKDCNQYYMFKHDFLEMRKIGIPLCATYYEEDLKKKKIITKFQYKSQSVLHSMGYTVNAVLDLSSIERQDILLKALNKNLFEINDLLSFLNWLIQTRQSQPKYEMAVAKWKEDMEFVKNYHKCDRDKIYIEKIITK